MKELLWLLFLPELIWLLAVAALALLQDRFIFRPGPPVPPPPSGWSAVSRSDDGLLGWWRPPADAQMPVILLFHGNRGGLARLAARAEQWPAGLFLATYGGYEGNPGKPSEQAILADARAALSWLEAQGIARHRIILYGESLGSGPAVRLGRDGGFAGLVLEAPFTSLVDAASERHPWAPARLLLRHRFDNLALIAQAPRPLLILHGDADQTMPYQHSLRLADRAGTTAHIIPDGGHIDLYDKGAFPLLDNYIHQIRHKL